MKNIYEIITEANNAEEYADVSKMGKSTSTKPTSKTVDDTVETIDDTKNNDAMEQNVKQKPKQKLPQKPIAISIKVENVDLSKLNTTYIVEDNKYIDICYANVNEKHTLYFILLKSANNKKDIVFTSEYINSLLSKHIKNDMVDVEDIKQNFHAKHKNDMMSVFALLTKEIGKYK